MYNIPLPYIRGTEDPNAPVQLAPGSQPSLATLKQQYATPAAQKSAREIARPAATPAPQPLAAAVAPAVAAPLVAPTPAAPEYAGTGIGVGAQGGEIFRRDAGSVPEFTNVNATPGLAGLVGKTGVAAGAAPVSAAAPATAGYGGFAPGEARTYLDTMAAQDAAKTAAAQTRRAAIDADVERIGLRNAMTSGTPQERRTARMQMEALDKQENLATVEAGLGARTTQTLEAELAKADIAGKLGLTAAQIKAMGDMRAAQTTGEYGLEAARTKAAGTVGAETAKLGSGANLKALQEAQTQEYLNSQLAQAIASNDVEAIKFYTTGQYAPKGDPSRDPVTGARYTPAGEQMQQQLLEAQLRSRLTQ